MDKPRKPRRKRKITQRTLERRRSHRLDKVFPVWLSSSAFGECQGIARNVSEGGMFVELCDPLPLGTEVRVHFAIPDSEGELVAHGQVRRHYFLQFADGDGPRALTGMGVRFTGFEEGGEELQASLSAGLRTLH
jgi:hypothetical protein